MKFPAGLPIYHYETHELLGYLNHSPDYDSFTLHVFTARPLFVENDVWSKRTGLVSFRLTRRLENDSLTDAWIIHGTDENIAAALLTKNLIRLTDTMTAVLKLAIEPINRNLIKAKISPPEPKAPEPEPPMPETKTRQEHLDWCKARAMAYIDAGNTEQAFASFASDVRKHPETAEIWGTIGMLGMPLLAAGFLNSPEEMRKHINGYN